MNLFKKELRLVVHPTSILFLFLTAMLIIPNYIYYTAFFYALLGIFFCCLTGRENHDITYTLLLPVRKRDVVKARFMLVTSIELAELILAIPFAFIRQSIKALGPNVAGMDANIAFFGFSLVLFGLFNLVFLSNYYKAPDKVGKAFIISNIWVWLYIIIVEALAHAVPFFKNTLDTPDSDSLTLIPKLIVLAAGFIIFILFTAISYKKSVASFEKNDL